MSTQFNPIDNLPIYPATIYPRYISIEERIKSINPRNLFINCSSTEFSPNDKEIAMKSFYNTVYEDGGFLKAIIQLLQEQDYASGWQYEAYAYYPYYPERDFEEGLICVAIGRDVPECWEYVTERECFKYSKEACLLFLEKYPEFTDLVMNILDNWKPKYPDKFP